MIWWRTCYSFILLLLITCSVHAQVPASFYTAVYRAEDGLPDSYVLKTFQDRQGYLWIGTYSGLSRFDGKYFVNYGLNNGLPDLFISAIAEDSTHGIWIGTRKGIGYIRNGTYVHTTFSDAPADCYIYEIQNSPSGLWASTTAGIYHFNGRIWEKRTILRGFENQACRGFIELHGSVYLNYGHSIIKIQKGKPARVIASTRLQMPYYKHFKIFHDTLYVGSDDGIWKMNQDSLQSLFTDQLKGDLIYTFFIDSRYNFWIALEKKGLLLARPNEKTLSNSIVLESNLVTSIMEDRDQHLWLSDFRGLVKLSPSFFSIIYSGKPNDHFRLFSDNQNELYLYSIQDGLSKWTGDTFTNVFSAQSFAKALRSDIVLDHFAADRRNRIWATTREGRLICLDRNKLRTGMFPILKDDYCKSVTSNIKNSKVYLCSSKLYVINNDSLQAFRTSNTGTAIEAPTSVTTLSNGGLLVNTRDSGLLMIDPGSNVFNVSKQIGLPLRTVVRSYEDSEHTIWISFPGSGLLQCRLKNNREIIKLKQITTADGLPNDVVESVIRDDQDRMWIVTLSGIVLLDLKSLSANQILVSRIHDSRVLDMNVNVSIASLIRSEQGDLCLSLYDKVVLFYPKRLRMNGFSIATVIEEVKLNLKKTNWNDYCQNFTQRYHLPVNLELPYNLNTLSFDYKGISFASFNEPVYSYKLSGYDTTWSIPDHSTTISFVGLPPGEYDFMVRSRTSASDWSAPAHFKFSIRQPFWNIWWFHLASILTATGSLLIVFRLRIRKLRKNNRLKEQLMELELKALKAQMNPHFIYNALNSIQSLILNEDKGKALSYLSKFSKLLRIILSHSEKNRITLDKELSMLHLYIELEELRLNYNFEYEIKLGEAVIAEREWIPPMLLQPFVENALWHGLSRKKGIRRLEIEIVAEEKYLLVRIEDNGIGRKTTSKYISGLETEDIHAMELLEHRLKIWNREKSIQHINITDLTDANGQPSGTMVIVRIRRS